MGQHTLFEMKEDKEYATNLNYAKELLYGATVSLKNFIQNMFKLGRLIDMSRNGVIQNTLVDDLKLDWDKAAMISALYRKYHDLGVEYIFINKDFLMLSVPELAVEPNDIPIKEAITSIANALHKRYSFSETDRLALLSLHRLMNRKVPLIVETPDINYFKYSPCCGCGSEAIPEEGFKILKLLNGANIPLCENCSSDEKDLDKKLIADMYYRYSLELEEAIDAERTFQRFGREAIGSSEEDEKEEDFTE